MNKLLKKEYPASFTIEAAVIVPITLVIMAGIMLISFYIHDRIVMQTAGINAVFGNINADMSPVDIRAAVNAALDDSLILTRDYSASVSGDEGACTVTASGTFDWKFPLLSAVFGSVSTPGASINISNLDGRGILLKYALADAAKEIFTEHDAN